MQPQFVCGDYSGIQWLSLSAEINPPDSMIALPNI